MVELVTVTGQVCRVLSYGRLDEENPLINVQKTFYKRVGKVDRNGKVIIIKKGVSR